MAKDFTEIKGFEELNAKLKKLPDKVKRREIIKIQKQLAKPIIAAYRNALPVGKRSHSRTTNKKSDRAKKVSYTPGNLGRSVKAETVPAGKVGGNPSIAVRPTSTGKDDGYYKFMVVPKGTKTGSIRRGSRIGSNTVVDKARDKALGNTGAIAQKQAIDTTAIYIQKQINKLSS
jgi:hypothetical protein